VAKEEKYLRREEREREDTEVCYEIG